jgi:hypothetical protein
LGYLFEVLVVEDQNIACTTAILQDSASVRHRDGQNEAAYSRTTSEASHSLELELEACFLHIYMAST